MKVLLTSAVRNAGMAAIRGLAEGGVDVVGADDRRLPFNSRSRYLRNFYLHPPVSEENAFLESLLGIVKRESPDVFFPIEGTHLIVEHAALFEPYTRMLLPPCESYKVAVDNQFTLEVCQELGIDCPRIFSLEEAENHLQAGLPGMLVVKPRKDIGAGRGVHFVGSLQAFYAAKKVVEDRFGRCVIQEYIPGATAGMCTVNLLFDRQSRLAAFFTTRKIRQWPTGGGISALSISTRDTGLVETIRPFFEKFAWTGLAEVELKVDERDRKAKVIEINPRVWGYFGFPIRCGVNFPLLVCRAAMDRLSPQSAVGRYRVGIKYVNPFAYLKAVLDDVRATDNRREWVARVAVDLQGKIVGNYWDIRDMRVIIAKALSEMGTERFREAF